VRQANLEGSQLLHHLNYLWWRKLTHESIEQAWQLRGLARRKAATHDELQVSLLITCLRGVYGELPVVPPSACCWQQEAQALFKA
tara:strand:+ start:179 stop:433 length:255 start_codon:yes stop_codon:yes gene_type:complete